MKDADAKGIKVLFGLILTQAEKTMPGLLRRGNAGRQDAQFDATIQIVNQYKKYKSVLAWTIGSELDPLTLPPENPTKVYRYIQRVARSHPGCGSLSSGDDLPCRAPPRKKPTSVKALAPDVDMIGCNSYGLRTPEVYNNYITVANWRGPYIYSVWGIEHPQQSRWNQSGATWTEPTWTPPVWKAPIEQLKRRKYLRLQDIYQM